MTLSLKARIFQIFGILFSTVPVIAAVLSYFPLWRERGADAVLSGFTLLLLVLSIVPLFKILKAQLRSAAAHTMWFIIFIFFYTFSLIADELTVISFVGFVGNLIGAILFKLAKRTKERNEARNEKI